MTGSTLMPGHAPLKDHPMANLFPLLPEKELAELADDIAANGQAETVKLHRGMILDGRNRYRACGLKKLAVRTEIFTGTDREALNYVISKNLKRRHLDESQRSRIADKITTLRLGDNQHSRAPASIEAPSFLAGPDLPDLPAVSQAEAAEIMNTSRSGVQRAAIVREKGAQELGDAVDSGKVAISTAATIAEALPVEQQKEIVKRSEKEILEAAKKIRKEQNDKRRNERIGRLATISAGNSELPTERKFPVLYIDPPTKFAAGDCDRSTENHYPTMTEEELAKLPIGALATDDAVMFAWTTVPWLRKTLRLIESETWGKFDYVSEFAWDKASLGMGFWNRNAHEVLLIATRGKMPAPQPSLLRPSLYREARGKHSAKPKYFRDLISAYYPDLPKVELFPRIDGALPEGWFGWGNQANVPQQQSLLPAEAAE